MFKYLLVVFLGIACFAQDIKTPNVGFTLPPVTRRTAQVLNTPNLGLNQPDDGTLNWGQYWRANFALLDSYFGLGGPMLPSVQAQSLTINGQIPLTTSNSTGTGNVALQNSPQLKTPDLDAATGKSIALSQGITLTQPSAMIQYNQNGNTDGRGIITLSGGSGSYTFQGVYANPPVCVLGPNGTAETVSTTSLSVTASGSTVSYICFGGVPVSNPPFTTFAAQTGSNGPACVSNGRPVYCNGAFTGFTTSSGNTAAQTQIVDPAPSHVSPLSIRTLMYAGWNGKVICAYQPWFYNVSPYNGHKNIFYSENSSSTVAGQHSAMIAEGCDIVSPDWYGTSSSQSFNQNTVLAQATDLAGRTGTPLKFLIMLDKGALSAGTSSLSGCPDSGVQDSCLENNINADLDYINSTWANQPYYAKDSSGANLVSFFVPESEWSGSNWTTIMTAVASHISGYSTPMKLLKEFGNFTETGFSGAYEWPQPAQFVNGSPSTQLCWDSITCSTSYGDTFYSQALSNSSKVAVGMIFKGFDWSNASWGSPQKIIAQQCGQVLLDSAAKPAADGYSTGTQLAYIQIPTWNDYEEGTEVETGINNCYTIAAAIGTPPTLTWSLTKTDATYATTSTIDHFTVWYEDSNGNLWKAQDNIAVGTSSLDISSLVPTGTWTIYVEMVGKALIQDQMSNGVSFTH